MQRISRILMTLVVLVSMGASVAYAQGGETLTYTVTEARLADTPSKYGFKGLYTLFDPATAQKGKYGFGLYWDMTRFALPGDPRYPQVMEFTLGGYYGITDRLEVGISAPFRSVKIPERDGNRFPDDPAFDEISESGFSNVGLGARYNLPFGDAFAMTPYILAYLPTASDPEVGTGADNTRIHFGMSAGTIMGGEDRPVRLYTQFAYQFATDYDQDRRDFTETPPYVAPELRPRFDEFGSNPLFHEYGNTLFYGAGFALPILTEDKMDLFSEFMFYHSLEDKDYIPMFEDGEELDVVQDGGIAHVGTKIGFGNGMALTAGWGAILFAEEPMYESPHWRAFAGLTYNKPETTEVRVEPPDYKDELPPGDLGTGLPPQYMDTDKVTPPPDYIVDFDCSNALKQLAMVHFEFDKATLTPEAIARLREIARILRACAPCNETMAVGYSQAAQSCTLNQQSLANLRNQNVPESVLNGLEPLRGILFASQRQFLDAVEANIGSAATRQYRDVLLRSACYGCDYMLEVQGHTDWVGTENYNMKLGARRARAIVYYLVYDEGINPARIVSPEKLAQGIIAGETYGETQAIQSNETDAGRAINRRGQFVTLTMR